jgi:hypothetical protein
MIYKMNMKNRVAMKRQMTPTNAKITLRNYQKMREAILNKKEREQTV